MASVAKFPGTASAEIIEFALGIFAALDGVRMETLHAVKHRDD